MDHSESVKLPSRAKGSHCEGLQVEGSTTEAPSFRALFVLISGSRVLLHEDRTLAHVDQGCS